MVKSAKEIFSFVVATTQEPERGNFTFRIDKTLMKKLKKKCEAENVSMSMVIEAFIRNLFADDKD